MSEDKYSVIMTAFEGNWEKLEKAVPDIFGRKGLDVHTVVHPDGLPSEVVAEVPRDKAERIASKLREYKAEVEITPTAEVAGVEHRAGDLWYSCVGEHFSFTEIENMVVTADPLGAKRHLDLVHRSYGEVSRCGFEDFFNHIHIAPLMTGMSPREAVRNGNVIAEHLKHDLSTCFPGRRFVIYLDPGEQVSFCQADDAPTEQSSVHRSQERAWCQHCMEMQTYIKRTGPDAEFPEADWGDCAVCGNEVLVAAPEALILVEPDETDTDH